MSQEQTNLEPKKVLDFLLSNKFDIEYYYQDICKETLTEKKRVLLLKMICTRNEVLLLDCIDKGCMEEIDKCDLATDVSSYCNELTFESKNHKKEKLHEVKNVIQSTKKILDHINSILNQNQQDKTQNMVRDPISSEELQKIQRSIENIDKISPDGKNKETKKLVQELYLSLEQLDSTVSNNK